MAATAASSKDAGVRTWWCGLLSQTDGPKRGHTCENRACSGRGSDLRIGDVALVALLRAHAMIMNGGVFHVFETLDEAELVAAQAGYRFFGVSEAAALLESARRVPESERGDLESVVDAAYSRVASDSILVEAFKSHFASHPGEYAPVDETE